MDPVTTSPSLGRPAGPAQATASVAHEPVDGYDILDKVAALPVSTWRYHWEPGHIRHLGPMAQDWQATFGIGSDGHTISLVDANGVLLVALQALHRHVQVLQAHLEHLEPRLRGEPGARPPGPTTP